jgi:hypothetical protein
MAVRRPHLVSVAVSRRFTDERGELVVVPWRGRKPKRIGPEGFGYTDRLAPTDPEAFEAVWKGVEDRLGAAIDAVEAGNVLGDATHEQTVRDCLAMHWARSADILRLDDDLFVLERDHIVADLAKRLRPDRRVEQRYRERHFGLVPASRELDRESRAIAEEIYSGAVESIDALPFRAERMIELYEWARARFGEVGLEVWAIPDDVASEFVLADAPAQALRHGHDGVGGLGGVPVWGPRPWQCPSDRATRSRWPRNPRMRSRRQRRSRA